MSAQHLSQKPARTASGLALHPQIALQPGRVHEACGPARRSFALWLAGQAQGPVLWISPAWEPGQLNPDGMMAFADPARFIFVHPTRAEDLLWCTEEALRSGAIPLIVSDLPGAPGLTPVRRMHLAAEQGGAMGRAPLGLLLTPGDGGAQGVETRWHMAARHQGEARRWTLTRRRARALHPVTWHATQAAARAGLKLQKTATEDCV